MNTIEFVKQHGLMAELQLAMTVVIIYDHITTIDREIEYIWRRKRSLPQILFIINRYVGDLISIVATVETVVLSPAVQNKIYAYVISRGIGITFVIWSMQGIMLHRISAMYNHSKTILFLMLSIYSCEVITMTVIVGIIISNIYVQEVVIVPDVATIKVAIVSPIICGTWIAPVIMEALLLSLALYAGFQHIAITREIESSNDRPSWVFVLVRDSILFPFIAFASYISTAIWWKFFTVSSRRTDI
ncbi:hypothetical protein BDQ17DRAFT_944349 [Cyathus striatus]|nr:hypothetical protein BDQ17DRAFT_944349 [Cyathus striatus]